MTFILILGLIIGAFMLGAKVGDDTAVERTYTNQKNALSNSFFPPGAPFKQVYGLPGAYMSDLNPKLEGAPLVVIQSSDFVKLVARSKEPTASEKRIEQLVNELVHSSRLASGLTEHQIQTLDSIFNKDAGERGA